MKRNEASPALEIQVGLHFTHVKVYTPVIPLWDPVTKPENLAANLSTVHKLSSLPAYSENVHVGLCSIYVSNEWKLGAAFSSWTFDALLNNDRTGCEPVSLFVPVCTCSRGLLRASTLQCRDRGHRLSCSILVACMLTKRCTLTQLCVCFAASLHQLVVLFQSQSSPELSSVGGYLRALLNFIWWIIC